MLEGKVFHSNVRYLTNPTECAFLVAFIAAKYGPVSRATVL